MYFHSCRKPIIPVISDVQKCIASIVAPAEVMIGEMILITLVFSESLTPGTFKGGLKRCKQLIIPRFVTPTSAFVTFSAEGGGFTDPILVSIVNNLIFVIVPENAATGVVNVLVPGCPLVSAPINIGIPAACLVNTTCVTLTPCLECKIVPSGTVRVVCPTAPNCTCAVPSPAGLFYATIQAAINASSAGDRIIVCPGTYEEQITINVNQLILESQTPLAAIIQNPQVASIGLPGSIVTITSSCVSLTGFTIRGPGPSQMNCSGGDNFFGITVTGGGSAIIESNLITEIHDSGLVPRYQCIRGRGIFVDNGQVIINNNTINNYQRNAIRVTNATSCATITNNTVTGGPLQMPPDNPFPVAQNGIVVSNGASARIENNTVTANIFAGNSQTSATGIMLNNPGPVCLRNNDVSGNQTGIAAISLVSGQITSNIASNGVTTVAQAAIGIFIDETSANNIVSLNTALNNIGTDSFGNTALDVQDLSIDAKSCGTADAWLCNICTTDNIEGCLCASQSPTTSTGPLSRSPITNWIPIFDLD